MNRQKQAIIISQHASARHQISALLKHHNWDIIIADHHSDLKSLLHSRPDMLIADIEGSVCRGMELLDWFKTSNPAASTLALCMGGNTPAMRRARKSGIQGFFYLNSSGHALDMCRGAASYLSRACTATDRWMQHQPDRIAA